MTESVVTLEELDSGLDARLAGLQREKITMPELTKGDLTKVFIFREPLMEESKVINQKYEACFEQVPVKVLTEEERQERAKVEMKARSQWERAQRELPEDQRQPYVSPFIASAQKDELKYDPVKMLEVAEEIIYQLSETPKFTREKHQAHINALGVDGCMRVMQELFDKFNLLGDEEEDLSERATRFQDGSASQVRAGVSDEEVRTSVVGVETDHRTQ